MIEDRIHPSWDEILNFRPPLYDGEEYLARFLDDSLPQDWEIFVQPYFNNYRPDIVVFHPRKGALVYEVKDKNLAFKKPLYAKRAFKEARKQVEDYRQFLIRLLVPRLGEKSDYDTRAFGLVKTAVYFHETDGKTARSFSIDKYPLVIGYDDLKVENIENILPNYRISQGYLESDLADEIRWWLHPPFHLRDKSNIITLSPEQQKHAEPKSGHFRLRGVVGSGKTLIIAHRAAKLASQGYKVLIVSFNITLMNNIHDLLKKAGFDYNPTNITIDYFHNFCKFTLHKLDYSLPSKGGWNNIAAYVSTALGKAEETGKDIDFLKYDAILIDEGQDFKEDWVQLLMKLLNERDELLIVCDKKQNIYKRDLGYIDGKMMGFSGRWRELKTIYRLPKKIGDIVNRFSQTFNLDQSIKVEKYIQLKLFGRIVNSHFVWKNIKPDAFLPHLGNAYHQIKSYQQSIKEGSDSDIVILLPDKNMGMQTVNHFEKQNTKVKHVFEDTEEEKTHFRKNSFWIGDGRLKMSTIHSYKGWEALHIIMVIPEKWPGDENLDSLVYTAMTRTLENLIVLNCNDRYLEFSKDLPHEWEFQ